MEGRGLAPMSFDDFTKFHDLLSKHFKVFKARPSVDSGTVLTTRILGLLSLVLPRFQLLGFQRKLCHRQLGTSSEGIAPDPFIACFADPAIQNSSSHRWSSRTSMPNSGG